MNQMLKNATTEELNQLLHTLWGASDITAQQADLMYSIVDELTERGEVAPVTKEETMDSLEKTRQKIADRQAVGKESGSEEDAQVWMPQLLTDVKNNQQKRRKRTLKIAASAAACILLINTITFSASGFNFLGQFFAWTGQAVYFLFGGETEIDNGLIHGELQALQNTLDELEMSVNLPRLIPEGFVYQKIEVLFEAPPHVVVGWFINYSTGQEFSISIDSLGGMHETDDQYGLGAFEHKGNIYYPFMNRGSIVIIWLDGEYEMSLQGALTFEEARMVIESI